MLAIGNEVESPGPCHHSEVYKLFMLNRGIQRLKRLRKKFVRAPRLSVVINTLNEEKNIAECIRSVLPLSPEIIVVDMHSDDKTVKIARKLGAKIFYHKRMGFVEPARNFALSKARGDWVLILDADERLKFESKDDFFKLLTPAQAAIHVYLIPRRNFLLGRWLEGTGWGMDVEKHLCLFRRGSVLWTDEIHSNPAFSGRLSDLPSGCTVHIEHFNYLTIHDFVKRLNNYTDHEANWMNANGAQWDLSEMLRRPFAEFKSRYEPDKDGTHSFILAGFMAFYRFTTMAKLWELKGRPWVAVPANFKEVLDLFNSVALQLDAQDQTGASAVAALPRVLYPESGCIVQGAYDDEGGWRWLSGDNEIEVPVGGQKKSRNFLLRLRSAKTESYEKFPFKTTVHWSGGAAQEVHFSQGDQIQELTFRLESSIKPARFRIQSEGRVKLPAEDSRTVSLILAEMKLTI